MRRLLAALALIALAGPALAQETRHDLAVKAVAAGFEPQLSKRIMDTYWPAALDLIKLRYPKATDLELFQYKGKINVFADDAAKAAMAPMVGVLEEGFSPAELEVLIEFYETSAGKKLNQAAGAITSTMSGAVTANLGTEITTLQGKIDAMLTADGH
jgi:hypothetical protein